MYIQGVSARIIKAKRSCWPLLTIITVLVSVTVITGRPTCLNEELVADTGVVDVVHGCREDHRERLHVRHYVLRHTSNRN